MPWTHIPRVLNRQDVSGHIHTGGTNQPYDPLVPHRHMHAAKISPPAVTKSRRWLIIHLQTHHGCKIRNRQVIKLWHSALAQATTGWVLVGVHPMEGHGGHLGGVLGIAWLLGACTTPKMPHQGARLECHPSHTGAPFSINSLPLPWECWTWTACSIALSTRDPTPPDSDLNGASQAHREGFQRLWPA